MTINFSGIQYCDLRKTSFANTIFKGFSLAGSNFCQADCRGADFTALDEKSFERAKLAGIITDENTKLTKKQKELIQEANLRANIEVEDKCVTMINELNFQTIFFREEVENFAKNSQEGYIQHKLRFQEIFNFKADEYIEEIKALEIDNDILKEAFIKRIEFARENTTFIIKGLEVKLGFIQPNPNLQNASRETDNQID